MILYGQLRRRLIVDVVMGVGLFSLIAGNDIASHLQSVKTEAAFAKFKDDSARDLATTNRNLAKSKNALTKSDGELKRLKSALSRQAAVLEQDALSMKEGHVVSSCDKTPVMICAPDVDNEKREIPICKDGKTESTDVHVLLLKRALKVAELAGDENAQSALKEELEEALGKRDKVTSIQPTGADDVDKGEY